MKFLRITAAVLYVIAFYIIYIVADLFTRPIIKLKDAAKRMASLDFSATLKEGDADEIGELIISLNTMAKNLTKNIEALNDSNEQLSRDVHANLGLGHMIIENHRVKVRGLLFVLNNY